MNIYKFGKISFLECEICYEEVAGRFECVEITVWIFESEEG